MVMKLVLQIEDGAATYIVEIAKGSDGDAVDLTTTIKKTRGVKGGEECWVSATVRKKVNLPQLLQQNVGATTIISSLSTCKELLQITEEVERTGREIWESIEKLLRRHVTERKEVSSPLPPEKEARQEPQPDISSPQFPSLETIYKKLRERGYTDEDIYLIIDMGRKSLESDPFPIREDEFSALAERLFTPLGLEKTISLALMFLEANPHLKEQCDISPEEITAANVRTVRRIRDFFYRKLLKTARYAIFRFINEKKGMKTLRDTLSTIDTEQWWMADYFFIRYHIIEKNIRTEWFV